MTKKTPIATALLLAAAFTSCRPAATPPALIPVAAEHDGVVMELHAGPGDAVTRNQILATLSWPEMETEIAQTRLDQQTAEQRLTETREQYLRLVQRQETGEVIGEAELNEARLLFERSQKQVAGIRSTRTRDERTLNQRFIRSPGHHLVHAVLVASNQAVSAGQTLMELAPAPPP